MEEEIKAQATFEDFDGDQADLITHIQTEYKIGYDWINQKRQRKLKERDLYVQDAEKDRVNIHSIFLQMQMLLALYYQDKTVVRFCGRTAFTEEIADNISKVAEFDADQMDLDTIDYDVEFDRFYTGVGVKIAEGWNNELKVPYARRIDSLTVIPDPKWGYRAWKHRWIGFEMSMSKAEMQERKFKNIEKVGAKSTEEQLREQRYNTARWYSTVNSDDGSHSVYFHFTQYKGKKYMVVTSEDRATLLDIVYLEPETPAEKKNPLLVPYPIAFKYFSPMPNDFYGVSVPDLLKDKQQRFSRLFNLAYKKAVRDVLGDDKLYDPNKIKNVRDLSKMSIEPRWIEANIEPGENISEVVYNVQKESSTNDPQNMMASLKQQMTESTGLDNNTLWVWADQTRTLWESQLIQQNANLRLGLITKFSNWWDEDFWKIYYRSLQYNLSGEKIVRLTRSFGDSYATFKREDIIGTESIDIRITTKSELDAQRAKESATFFSTYATDLSMTTNVFEKNFIMRKKYRLQGWTSDEIKMVVRDTPDEILARQDVMRINYGLDPLPIASGQDHYVWLAYLEWAVDSDKKKKAIEQRKQALFMLIQTQQQQASTQQQQWMIQWQANASSAQLTTQSLQNMSKQQGSSVTASVWTPNSDVWM